MKNVSKQKIAINVMIKTIFMMFYIKNIIFDQLNKFI
jgi:hypothetical protein